MLTHVVHHAAQVLHVEQEHAAVVRHAKNYAQNAGLGLIEAEEPPEKKRTHFADGGSDGYSAFTENVPEAGGVAFVLKAVEAEALNAFLHIFAVHPRLAHAAEVALHIREENRHAEVGKGLRHNLEGYGLAGSGGSGYEAVAVRHGGLEKNSFAVMCHPNFIVFQHMCSPFLCRVITSSILLNTELNVHSSFIFYAFISV